MSMLRTEAREDLRNQVGNLRFDLNTLIEKSSKSKADKKAATQLKKDFLIKVGIQLCRLHGVKVQAKNSPRSWTKPCFGELTFDPTSGRVL